MLRKRKGLLFVVVITVLAVIISACQTPQTVEVEVVVTATPEPEAERGPLRIYCQVKDASAVFWQGAILGCQQAAEELGPDKVELIFTTGTSDMGVEDSIKAFEDALAAGADGIVLAPADSAALVPSVQEANEMGIPVVAMDTAVDAPANLLSTVATDNFNGVMDAVARLIEDAGGKGKFALTACPSTISTCRDITSGFIAALEQFPEAEVVAMPLACPSREKGYNALQDILVAHPDLAGVFGCSGQDGLGAAEAIRDAGSSALVVTRNCSMEELESVSDGLLHACFAQYPRLMGYRGVMALYEHYQGMAVETYTDSGSDYVGQDKVQSYIDLGEWMGPPE
jgi:ribose transport system substrate-binding protein